ncbi:MAG: HD domain-containing protein [Treponema sp.]|jgi:HD superfamily phosphohydrolase|nr:HD domain-containing protein [Treponema sp.]
MRNDPRIALGEGYTDPIRDPLWGHIYLTPALAALTRSAAFIRLSRISQLGPVSYVYPGATHTRASHSIGVYHLGRRLLQNLAERGAHWLSAEGVHSFLCACLLHDLGHFPYTHSLKELPLESHESLTAKLISREPVRSLVGATGADPDFCAAIVDAGLPARDGELLFYRKLLSGALDPDKLDYLNRDARYCGVPYGIQDVDFIFSRLFPDRERGVDIDSRGIPGVESVLFSKYLMYRTVYWHHSVRSATGMIKKALIRGLEDKALAPEELYNLDDQSLFALMKSREGGGLFSLAAKVQRGDLFSLAAEFPFDPQKHGGIRDLKNRSRYENALARELSAALGSPVPGEDLIIDIPEPFSLETGLYVRNEDCYFSESSSAFTAETVLAFAKSLYVVRVFTDSAHASIIQSSPKLTEILHITEKWLQL